MFSRAFCCFDFSPKIRSWKRRGSGRKVAASNRRICVRRDDSIVIGGALHSSPTGRAARWLGRSAGCRVSKEARQESTERFSDFFIRLRSHRRRPAAFAPRRQAPSVPAMARVRTKHANARSNGLTDCFPATRSPSPLGLRRVVRLTASSRAAPRAHMLGRTRRD
jgi:hypothetical protein